MKNRKAPHVVIVVEGGLVQAAWMYGRKSQPLRLTLVDHDSDGIDPTEPDYCKCRAFGGKEHFHSTRTEGNHAQGL